MKFDEKVSIRERTVRDVHQWYWITEDEGVWQGPSQEWQGHEDYFKQYCQKCDVVVQAGGACGMYPRLFKNFFDYVFTFEPDPLNFHTLVLNCQDEKIFKFNAALGDQPGFVTLERNHISNVGMHRVTLDENGPDPIKVPVMTIDNLNLWACDAICLDVEGYEMPVLLGAMETIAKFKPVISLECPKEEIGIMLAQHGYVRGPQVVSDTFYIQA